MLDNSTADGACSPNTDSSLCRSYEAGGIIVLLSLSFEVFITVRWGVNS